MTTLDERLREILAIEVEPNGPKEAKRIREDAYQHLPDIAACVKAMHAAYHLGAKEMRERAAGIADIKQGAVVPSHSESFAAGWICACQTTAQVIRSLDTEGGKIQLGDVSAAAQPESSEGSKESLTVAGRIADLLATRGARLMLREEPNRDYQFSDSDKFVVITALRAIDAPSLERDAPKNKATNPTPPLSKEESYSQAFSFSTRIVERGPPLYKDDLESFQAKLIGALREIAGHHYTPRGYAALCIDLADRLEEP